MLPKGYSLAKSLDNRKKPIGLNAIKAILAFMISWIILILPIAIFKGLGEIFSLYFSCVVFFGGAMIGLYSCIFIGIQSLTMYFLTHKWGKFGYIRNDVFYSVPGIFVTRKAAFLYTLLPIVFPSILFIVVMLLPVDVLFTHFVASVFFATHIAIVFCDSFPMLTMLAKCKDENALVNFAGVRFAIFTEREDGDETDEASAEYLDWLHNEGLNMVDEENKRKSKIASTSGSVIFFFEALLFAFIFFLSVFSVKYPIFKEVILNPSLYLCVLFIGLIIYFELTRSKYYVAKVFIATILTSLTLLLLVIAVFLGANATSHTTDIKNYGSYDDICHEVTAFLPEQITEDMTPIRYSYYYDASWDIVFEVYLEVKMTDDAYEALKAEYSDSLTDFQYAEGYEEYSISDNMLEDLSDDGKWIGNPDISKIIFNDADKIVIFELMHGHDPFYLENSAYIDRFNIEPLKH